MSDTTKLTYFRVTFLAIAAGISAGLMTKGLFNNDFGDPIAIRNLIFESLITGIAVGVVMGLLNMYFKAGPFKRKAS